MTEEQMSTLKEEYKNQFGNQTFCDNCGVVLSEEQEYIFSWFISKIKDYEKTQTN